VIVLDTNVVSEPMKRAPDPAVRDWLDRQNPETLYLTAVSLAELMAGLDALPDGKRKDGLRAGSTQLLLSLFGPRILPFDQESALAFCKVQSQARAANYTMPFADAQIAAIALRHGFSVATRDTAPFLAAGVPVVDPWREGK